MWIFTWAPDWAIHAITIVGILGLIASFVLGFVPFIKQYKLPLQVVAGIITALGIYLQGGLADNKEWLARVAEMEKKVAEAQVQSGKTNVVVQEKIVTKTQVVREKGQEIVKYLDRIKEVPVEVQGPEREKIVEVIKYVENCPVPQLLVDQLNNAATSPLRASEPKK